MSVRPHDELRHACSIVAHKDVQPLRRALFEQLASRTPALRATLAAWNRLGSGRSAAAFVSSRALKCFLEVRFPTTDADLLAVWKYRNEQRQFAALQALDPALRIESITLDATAATAARGPLFRPRELGQGWGIVREYAGRGDFLVAARVAETVGYYTRMLPLLAQSRAPVVLVSSDTNPYAVALVAAARRLGRKTCFVTHGHVAEGPPPLEFDLSLLDGLVLREVYERAGPVRGTVVFRGSEGVVRSMNTSGLSRSGSTGGVKTLGIFLSILVDWQSVGALLDRLRMHMSPQRFVLRLHPNRTMRLPRWNEHLNLQGVQVSEGDRPLTEDANACDLVVAGNSSAHLSVLKSGVPTVYVAGLDGIGVDYYDFVGNRIVPAIEGDGSIDKEAVAAFYRDPGWPDRFARFDAGYPDRQPACDRAAREGLLGLLAGEDRRQRIDM